MLQYTFEELRGQFQRAVESRQPRRFAAQVWHRLGLCDEAGREHRREDGAPTLAKERKNRVSDFPLEALTEAMLGHGWKEKLGLSETGGDAFPVRRWLREEAAAPVGPSFFANVAAWSATVGGLIRAQVLEGYETPDYELADIFPVKPPVFWQGGERFVGIFGPMSPARKVGPGQAHPDVRMDSMWVEPGPMAKYGFKLTVAKETAFVDITGGRILQEAKTGGQTLRWRESELSVDAITGLYPSSYPTSQNFKLGLTSDSSATGYNTYGATINGVLVDNDFVNPMSDWTCFQAGDTKVASYRHPLFPTVPIKVAMNTLIVPTPLESYAKQITGADKVQIRTQMGQPVPAAASTGYASGVTETGNPYKGMFTIISSLWLNARHTASATQTDPELSPGAALTNGTTANRWYRCDPSKFACRRQAWPANIIDLNPSDFVMADLGIIAGQVGDIATQVQVLNPWAIQRNKQA